MPPVTILVCVVIALTLLQQISPRLGGHPVVFLGCNLFFLALIMDAHAAGWLAAFLGINYTLAAVGRRYPAIPSSALVVSAVTCFAVFKKYDILPLSTLYAHIPDLLGLSYIIFRTLIVIFEARDIGTLPSIVSYLNFCLSMLTFLSGPIQRYSAFSEDMERRKTLHLNGKEAATALTRLMNGVIKVIFLAPVAQSTQDFFMLARMQGQILTDTHGNVVTLHGSFEILGDMTVPFGFGIASLFYLLFLYFNFSGYTDMVIGLGRLVGFRLPENFDNPFVATSFLDFWKRWHISLSVWFRDYCFMPAWSVTRGPVSKVLMRMGMNDPAIATLPAYFISFGLLGLWHGRTWPFMLCGLMFAAGSSINHLWRARLSRVKNKEALERLNRNPLYQSFASALTLFYISIAVTGLWLPDEAFTKDWRAFTPGQAAYSFSMILVCLASILYLGRWLWRAEGIQNMAIRPFRTFFTEETPFMIATKIFALVVWFFTFSTNLPTFVYTGF